MGGQHLWAHVFKFSRRCASCALYWHNIMKRFAWQFLTRLVYWVKSQWRSRYVRSIHWIRGVDKSYGLQNWGSMATVVSGSPSCGVSSINLELRLPTWVHVLQAGWLTDWLTGLVVWLGLAGGLICRFTQGYANKLTFATIKVRLLVV